MTDSDLPDGWRWAKLGDVCAMGSGGTPKRGNAAYFGGTIPWVMISDLNDSVIMTTKETITDAGLRNSSAKLIPAGALLIAMYGSVGKLGVAGVELTTNQAIAHIHPDPVLDRQWLFYRLMADRERLAIAGSGITQNNISQTVLKQWKIPLPPLDEQRRIVARLEEQMATAEQARAAAVAQLAAIQAMPQALLREIFPRSPAARLPRGWRWAKLEDVVVNTPNVDPRSDPVAEFSYIDISAIDRNAKAIRNTKTLLGAVAPSRARRAVAVGDVIVSTTRPNLNAVALVPPELDGAVCSTGFCVLRCGPTMTAAYLYHLVQSQDFVEQMTEKMTGASYPAVTDKVVRAFSFPLPPVKQQIRLVEQLEQQSATIEGLRRTAQAQLDALDALPAATLRLAFAP